MNYLPPSSIAVAGSLLLSTTVTQTANIDLTVQMPSECFSKKDFINMRYFCKRAFYLSKIAEGLNDHFEMHYEALNGDTRRPVLVLTERKAPKVVEDVSSGKKDKKKGKKRQMEQTEESPSKKDAKGDKIEKVTSFKGGTLKLTKSISESFQPSHPICSPPRNCLLYAIISVKT
jgi:Nrap protein domain 1